LSIISESICETEKIVKQKKMKFINIILQISPVHILPNLNILLLKKEKKRKKKEKIYCKINFLCRMLQMQMRKQVIFYIFKFVM